jgi:hypothetical protein
VADIPRTIDLVMEKTKHMILTEEEKQAARLEESGKRAAGLFNFLSTPEFPFSDFESRLRKAKSENLVNFDRILLEYILEHLDFQMDYSRILDGLKLIAGDDVKDELDRLEHLCRTYTKEIKFSSGDLGKKILKKLANKGISGSAVKPKVEGSSFLKKEFDTLNEKFKREFNPIRTNILKTTFGA